MKQTNREAFNEFARGATVAICAMAFSFLLIALVSKPANIKSEEKFVVVDQYRGCDVVRYTDPSNSWNYFLDCSGNRP